jgi:hypothetical protein
MKKLLLIIALIGAVAAAAAAFRRDDVKKAATSATNAASNMTQKGTNGADTSSRETVDSLSNGAADLQGAAGTAPMATADVAGSAADLPGESSTSN